MDALHVATGFQLFSQNEGQPLFLVGEHSGPEGIYMNNSADIRSGFVDGKMQRQVFMAGRVMCEIVAVTIHNRHVTAHIGGRIGDTNGTRLNGDGHVSTFKVPDACFTHIFIWQPSLVVQTLNATCQFILEQLHSVVHLCILRYKLWIFAAKKTG